MLSIVLWALAALFVCGGTLVMLCCCRVASIADERMERELREWQQARERRVDHGYESGLDDD